MKKIRSKYTQPDFQFIRFRLGGREFGIDVTCVKEIMRLKATVTEEGAFPFGSGMIKIRSMTIPLVDLRKRFNLPVDLTENSRIIIVSIESFITGLIVDEVSDIALGAKEVTLKPEPRGEVWDPCLEALVDTGNGKVLILEPSRLLTEDEKKALSCPASGV
ncbi:MAG: hypothetical protein A2054_00115 [Deltaproteobacteria bacterium GWA2_55_10]|nr:MAG: hypothetical protein A2054_00115 [Deltaproteobacteria bacterium GWA2_55_10]